MTHSANRNNNEDVVAWFSGSSVMGTEDTEDGTGWWLIAYLAHLMGSFYKGKVCLLRTLHSGELR